MQSEDMALSWPKLEAGTLGTIVHRVRIHDIPLRVGSVTRQSDRARKKAALAPWRGAKANARRLRRTLRNVAIRNRRSQGTALPWGR